MALLFQLSKAHGARLGADELNAPWCARSFRALHAMRISVALHLAAADEILMAVHIDTALAAEGSAAAAAGG